MLRRKGAMLCRNMNRASETFEMHHPTAAADARSESHLVAEARMLQARHARGALGAAVRRLRSALARLAGEPADLEGRQLTVR